MSPSAAASVRRRGGWGWLLAFVVVAALGVAGWFLAEGLARDLVVTTIRDQVVSRLGLPAYQEVEVTVTGTVIPQLIAGTLDEVAVSSDDVPLGDALTGDVVVNATELRFRGDASAGSAAATVTLDEEQLRTLMATVDGFPADTLGLAAPDVTMSTELAFFTARFPIGIALTPSARGGELVLSPAQLRLGEALIDADDLRDRFGSVADAALRDWNVCIAQYLPAAVTLEAVAVRGDRMIADLVIDPRVIDESALQAAGVCG